MATETRILDQTDENKLPLSEKLTFGFGNLAANLMLTTASSFITYYYTDVVGLSAVIVSVVLVGIALMITGGIVGLLSGASPFKRGLRQLAIGWGAAAVTYCLGLIFDVSVS